MVGITAAMPGGTGMDVFGKFFPKRTFDVGIAEQHAVTFAAGMAVEGLKPFCAIYSTFLQRGYDQVVHDCVIQSLPGKYSQKVNLLLNLLCELASALTFENFWQCAS